MLGHSFRERRAVQTPRVSSEKLRDSLLCLEPRVELSADLMARARAPIERMLALK